MQLLPNHQGWEAVRAKQWQQASLAKSYTDLFYVRSIPYSLGNPLQKHKFYCPIESKINSTDQTTVQSEFRVDKIVNNFMVKTCAQILRPGIMILKASYTLLLTCGVFRYFELSLGTATKAIFHQAQVKIDHEITTDCWNGMELSL